jgi:hypothetical protein
MGFYKETSLRMERFTAMIETIPTHTTKMNTILIETIGFRNALSEMPKMVIQSIRHNVTSTMESETKYLREELSKASETLNQIPTTLNIYVEQVNTLKYVKEKMEDFNQRFNSIQKLQKQGKNFKVSTNLSIAIDDVKVLYDNLPQLLKNAQEGLRKNKEVMEKIMHSSSLTLSKKIKAFEKKYAEHYLIDKTRLDECHETLEELFKRSKAI